jgi:hypothetical protein
MSKENNQYPDKTGVVALLLVLVVLAILLYLINH